MTVAALLAVNALITALAFFILWLVACRIRDVSFVDSWWAVGLVLTAWVSFANASPNSPHAGALIALCTLWGLRLGLYLLWRWRRQGPDRRYAAILGKAQAARGWSFERASLLLVFALQAPLQFIVSLPVQLGQMTATDAGPLAYAGIALAIFGIAFEGIADGQLVHFKRNPANKDQVLSRGLWRYTRHPNYFGDACVWWGLYLIAADTGLGVWSLPGPLLLTYLLTSWSGVPTVEGNLKRNKPGYADYVARTSRFVPMPPRG